MKSKTNKKPGNKFSSPLIIKQAGNKPVGIQQKLFNSLVTKIEKLRKQLIKASEDLDNKLQYYAKHIMPLEAELQKLNTQNLQILYPIYLEQKLSKAQNKLLRQLIEKMLGLAFQNNPDPTDELKEMLQKITGFSLEQIKKEGLEEMHRSMAEMFENAGFDVDLDGFSDDMTEEERMKKMMEMQDQIRQQAEAKEKQEPRDKKSKKQIAQEEKERKLEEARKKNIGNIYRQLAKALHPDLEQNEDLKLQKEELMKQVTIAYKNNDLHTLLRLELDWIHREEKNLEGLTNEKLAIYNEVLREQVWNLESEMEQAYEHPKYHLLHKLVIMPYQLRFINLKEINNEKEGELIEMRNNHTQLNLPHTNAFAHLKKMLKEFKMQMRFDASYDNSFPS